MEVNCNGHTLTTHSEVGLESQTQEDEQNANQPDAETETNNALGNENYQSCNGTDPPQDLQQISAPLGPDAVTDEMTEGEKEQKKEEDMDTQGETKTKEEDEDGQNGLFTRSDE